MELKIINEKHLGELLIYLSKNFKSDEQLDISHSLSFFSKNDAINTNIDGNTPLHEFFLNLEENDQILDIFYFSWKKITHPEHLKLKNSSGKTIFEIAAERNFIKYFEVIFKYKSHSYKNFIKDITEDNEIKTSIFNTVSHNNHKELFILLLKYLKIPNNVEKKTKNFHLEVFKENLANQFFTKKGLDDFELGQINLNGAKLGMARLKEKYGKNFQGTVLENKEIHDYLENLKNSKGCGEYYFIISSYHYVSGMIEKSLQGINVLILNSLGDLCNTGDLIDKIAELIPQAKIYCNYIQKQFSGAGCSIFSLDDIHRLYQVKRYLPEDTPNKTIFGYFEKYAQKFKQHPKCYSKHLNVNWVSLPLYLLANMQSLTQLSTWEENLPEEALLIKFKQKRNFCENIVKDIFWNKKEQKYQNRHLDHRLKKMYRNNRFFLSNLSLEDITEKMEEVSFFNLKNK